MGKHIGETLDKMFAKLLFGQSMLCKLESVLDLPVQAKSLYRWMMWRLVRLTVSIETT